MIRTGSGPAACRRTGARRRRQDGRACVAGLLGASLALPGCADPARIAVPPPAPDDAYAIAASLVAEAGPRFAGTEGDARAVRWALRTLTDLGFANVRAEPVTVPRWERGPIRVEVTAPRVLALDAVALGGSVATPPDGIEAPVMMVGSVEALEALPEQAAQERIVFINVRMQRTRDGSGYAAAVPARRQGPAVAGRKGARAVLIRSIGTDVHAHTGTTRYGDGPKVPAAALSGPSADALEQALAAGPVRVRVALGARTLPDAQSANVVGEIPGASDGIVLLAAHLDSWDITPGANDDAAGVGIVVAAARRVAALGRPRCTIRVVLFANEEFGASGARAYARAHATEAARHVLALEADSGSFPPFRLDAAVTDGDWSWVQGLAAGLGLEAGANHRSGGVDVAELRKLGVPEVIVSQDDSRYFDVHHTAADTVETLDRAGIAQATAAFAAIAHAASERAGGFGRLAAGAPP